LLDKNYQSETGGMSAQVLAYATTPWRMEISDNKAMAFKGKHQIRCKIITLSSVLIKIQKVPILNLSLHHEDIRGSGGTAPRIHNLGTRRR
jgi:hypothetical protein